MKKLFYILLIFNLLTVGAQEIPTLQTRLTADTIMIGDQIHMQVDIAKDLATEIMIPDFGKGQLGKNVEIIGLPTVDTLARDGRAMKIRLSYTLTSFEAGEHSFGSYPLVYNAKNKQDTIESKEILRLVVKTFDIDTATMQIADIKQPLGAPLKWVEIKELVLYSALAALILGIIIYLVIRWLKRRKGVESGRADEPPHITAIRALEKLHAQKLPQSGKYKEYFSGITDTLRQYIERRYGIGAPEMITPEIIASLQAINDEKLVRSMGELFSLADLAKFAKWSPTLEECEASYHAAYNYVEETKIIAPTTNPEQNA